MQDTIKITPGDSSVVSKEKMVSVIIPAYNAEKHIRKAVRSILKAIENYSFEIIVINDGSEDDTGLECERLAEEIDVLRYFSKENGGPTVARKTGVETANGKFIVFCDADDSYFPSSIDKLVEIAENRQLDIAVGTSLDTSDDGSYKFLVKNNVEGEIGSADYISALLKGEIIHGPACRIIRKNLFSSDSFNLSRGVSAYEDLYMNICLAKNADKIGIYNEHIVYNYNVEHFLSEGSQRMMSEEALIELIEKIRGMVKETNADLSAFQFFSYNLIVRFKLNLYFFIRHSKKFLDLIFENNSICPRKPRALFFFKAALGFKVLQPVFRLRYLIAQITRRFKK